jgi:mlo protein
MYITSIAITAELMVLGFISLLLTFGQSYISRICLPAKVVNTMLPCSSSGDDSTTESRRRLLWDDRRFLAAGSYAPSCKEVSVSIYCPSYSWILNFCYF